MLWKRDERKEVIVIKGRIIFLSILSLVFIPMYAGLLFFATPVSNVYGSEVAAKQVTLTVEGLCCVIVANMVKEALEKLPGVINAKVSFEKGEAVISYQEDKVKVEQMIKTIEDAGYKAYPITQGKGK